MLLLPYSLVGAVRRRPARPLAAPADPGVRQRAARRAWSLGVAALVAAGVDRAAALRRRPGLPVGQPVLPRRPVRGAAARRRTRRLVMANAVSTTTGTVVAIAGGGIGYRPEQLVGDGSAADAGHRRRARRLPTCGRGSPLRMDRDLLGPDLADEPRGHGRRSVAWLRGHGRRGAGTCGTHRRPAAALAAIGRAPASSTASHDRRRSCCFRNYFNDPDGRRRPGWPGSADVLSPRRRLGFLLAAVDHPVDGHPPVRKATLDHVCFAFAGASVGCGLRRGAAAVRCCSSAPFVLGVAAQGSKICVDTIVQESIDDAYRGRVFSFYDMVFNVGVRVGGGVRGRAAAGRRQLPAVFAVDRASATRSPRARPTARRRRARPAGLGRPRSERPQRSPAQHGEPAADVDATSAPDSGWSAHQARSSASAASSGRAGRGRAAARAGAGRPGRPRGPGGTPRIAMIALPSRSGRIASSSSCSRSRAMRSSRSS